MAKKKTKKNKIKIKNCGGYDPLADAVSATRKRLRIAKMGRDFTMGKLGVLEMRIADADKKLLKDKRADIKRRHKIFRAIAWFERDLKAYLGRRITVKTRLSNFDEINVTTYFRPIKKGGMFIGHPTDGDAAVLSALDDSGLDQYMEFIGCGTSMSGKDAGVRDHSFVELKPQLEAG